MIYLRHLLRNPNKEELSVLEWLPYELRKFFPKDFNLEDWFLIITRYIDYDWNYSKTAWEYWKINNVAFWKHIDELVELLININYGFLIYLVIEIILLF